MKADFIQSNIFFVWENCTTDRILNSTLYDSGVFTPIAPDPFFTAVTSQNPHLNGIDIYLLPPSHPCNSGKATGIPGKALVLGGSFWLPQYPHFIPSRVLSHEMGHCLGLYHTFQSWPDCPDGEYVDMSNCCDCGDLVCDTRAYPGTLFEIDPEICDFDTNGALDAHNQPYDPDETLIMNYVPPTCMKKHTPEQGMRMRHILQEESIDGGVLGLSILSPTFVDHTVTSPTENWTTSYPASNGEVKIFGNLTVEDGAVLTINSGVTVRFGELSNLIIKPNGRVILHGTLTSMACGHKWRGVEVQGKGNNNFVNGFSQYLDLTTGKRHQGRIDCKNASVVENAEVGAKLWGPNSSKSGGLIFCDGAIFRNNRINIDFKPFKNFWPYAFPPGQQGQPRDYISSITNCTFEVNADYPHVLGFHSFLKMEGVTGVTITGGTFKNLRYVFGATNIGAYGYGLFATNAGFRLSGSTFKGLGYGIYAAKTTSGTNRPYSVSSANFEECYVSIYNNFVSGSTILFSNFKLGKVQDFSLINSDPNLSVLKAQIGVHFDNSIQSYACEGNDFFRTSNEVPTTIGVVCRKTGDFSNAVRKNYFTGINICGLANDINGNGSLLMPRGLLYECNENADIEDYDFAVKNGSISRVQGTFVPTNPTPTYFAAGNKFSYTAIQDFYNDGPTVDYYYNPAGTNEEPLTYSGLNGTPKVGLENNCSSNYFYCPNPPCPQPLEDTKEDYYYHEAAFNHLANMGGTTQFGKEMATHRLAMDTNAAIVLHHLQADTMQFNQDSLNYWIAKLGTLGGDVWLAGNHLASDNFSSAVSILNGLATKYGLNAAQTEDIENLEELFTWLNGKNESDLNAEEKGYLEDCLEKGGFTQAFAQNTLRLYGHHFTPLLELPTGGGSERDSKPAASLVELEVLYCQVFPNPTKDVVTFSWGVPTGEKAVIEIFNTQGLRIQAIPVEHGIGQTQWCADTPGLYFYRFVTTGSRTVSGKVVVH